MRLDATAWLRHLDDARTLALAGDVEGVHQVRVALRRLRVWVSFRQLDELEDELRWLCGELAPLRDLDVFGEVLTTEAREALRPEAVSRAVKALESTRWLALRDGLAAVRPPRGSKAKRALPRLEKRLKRRQRAMRPGDGAALHAARRALRRVRYAREWLGLDASEHAQQQERLGAVCDLLALAAFAKEHHAEAPEPLREAIARAFAELEAHR